MSTGAAERFVSQLRLFSLIALIFVVSTGASSAGPVAPSGPLARPSATPVSHPSEKVAAYAEVYRADVERARIYLKAAEAEIIGEKSRIDALVAQAIASPLKPTTASGLNFWYSGALSAPRTSIQRNDQSLAVMTKVFASSFGNAQTIEHNELTQIDGNEHGLTFGLELTLQRLWDVRVQEATWEIAILNARIYGRSHEIAARYDQVAIALYNDLIKAHENATLAGSDRAVHEKLDSNNDIQLGTLCSEANAEDRSNIYDLAGHLHEIATRLVAEHKRIFENFGTLLTNIEKTDGGAKSEIMAATALRLKGWLGSIQQGDNSPLWPDGFPMRPSFHPNGASTRAAYLPCKDWRGQTPIDIETRFPLVSAEFSESYVVFKLVLGKAERSAGDAEGRAADLQP